MSNIFSLAEVSYEKLFSTAGIAEGDRDRRLGIEFDAQKFTEGMANIRANFANLGRPSGKGAARTTPHFLGRDFMTSKGLDCSKLGPYFQHWFCTFDLPSRGSNSDPNGPRRIITVCQNNANSSGRYMSSEGGIIIYVLYTNNHYGDGGKTPAFLYVNSKAAAK